MNIKIEQQAVLVCCSYYSDRKSGKSLPDFPHNAVRYHLLRFTIPEYGFSVMECYLHNGFHIKGDGAEQIIPCLPQCFRLDFGDDGRKFLFCDSFRNLLHLIPVFGCSAAVTVLCVTGVVESAVVTAGV